MKINNLKLLNFRNYEKLDISFSDNLNVIYGLNGSGKTNIVEAIYMLSLTKSFRINNDKVLIRKGCVKTTVEGEIFKNNDTSNYKVCLNNEGKSVEIDSNKVDKISDYVSKINVVLFNPTDTNIFVLAPTERRKLINIEISQLNKEYLVILANYNRILKQRNFYLKQLYVNGNSPNAYLDILTKKLIEYGLMINKYRNNFIDSINEYIGSIYKNIFGSGELKIKYISNYNNKSESDVLSMYKKYYTKELALGKTALGVHHDDISFMLDGNVLKEWGSEGQRKNAIISFKLAEIAVIYKQKKEYPILILDDLFSELDKAKISNILKMLNNEVQTFITTTEVGSIKKSILKISKIFHVEDGIIEEVTK